MNRLSQPVFQFPCYAIPKVTLPSHESFDLLVILLLLDIILLLSCLGLLSPDTTRAAATEGRGKGEVDVLLGVETDNERRDVDDLLADADVALADEDTSVVDGLGEAELVDAGLEAALKEILDLEGKDVIELHSGLVKDTDADETANESIALEETLGVLLVKSKELTSSTTNLGEGEEHTPHLTLVAETVLADELQLSVQSSGLEGATGDLGGLGVGKRRHCCLVAATLEEFR